MSALPSIYGLCHPETMELRYIGKANDPAKRLKAHLRDSRRRKTPVYAWIRKLASSGLLPEVVVLADDCEDWEGKERELISRGRSLGHRLLNVADGGDEPKCPPATRMANGRLAASRKGEPWFWLIQQFGRYARERTKAGRHEDAAKSRHHQRFLQSMSVDEAAAFNATWIARGNYYPGKPKS